MQFKSMQLSATHAGLSANIMWFRKISMHTILVAMTPY